MFLQIPSLREREREMGSNNSAKHHLVFVSAPGQGHITPILKLAKLLHTHGFCITFVNTHYAHRRLLKSKSISLLGSLPDFRFDSVPDGQPLPKDEYEAQDMHATVNSIAKAALPPFIELIKKINDPSSCLPPVSYIISDGAMSFTLDAAKELNIPELLVWTPSACSFMAYLHYPDFIERGLFPLKDEADITNGYMDTPIDWIPGLKNMRMRDIPTFIRTTDPKDTMFNYNMLQAQRAPMGSAIILNTFDELEGPVLEAMASMLPPIYTLGPLNLLSDQQISESPLTSLRSTLWKEDSGCLEWLEGREPESVVYVNYGTHTTMTNEQLVEFAWGLANSKHDFLWVLRSDLVNGDKAVLPQEFLEETKERSFLASWCSQEAVLSHPSIGGFLTHSGWNSTIESISAGVPMLCWPFFADQQTNCRYVCTEWGNGMEIDNDVKRGEVEGLIRELMGGEKGKQVRSKAKEWKESALKATKPGGSSYTNLEKLVKEVLL